MSYEQNAELTPGAPHVRDDVDLRGVMWTVVIALSPCIAFGLYNTGYQVNIALLEYDLAPSGWRAAALGWVGAGHDASSIIACSLLGALHFVPLLAIALAVGGAWERLFAKVRGRSRTPGLAVTAWLFAASLPPTLPWWEAVLGITFAIVIGKEIFGGTGRNVFNPAVIGLAFLYFAYPADMRGAGVWVAVEGATESTWLHIATAGGATALAEHGASWFEAFLGRTPGAIGDTSALGCILGALYMVHRRVASWRIMLGVLVGAFATGALLPGPAPEWHLVLGSLAFGAVFFATDPVTSAATDAGRWVYGLLIGFLIILIRVANPLHTEGVLLAILLGNAAAPLIDHGATRLHVLRRRRPLGRI